MRRWTGVILGLLTGGVIGATGCITQGACDDGPVTLRSNTYVSSAAVAAFGGEAVDGDLEVEVDADAETVAVRFRNEEGRDVEVTFAITSQEQGWL
ncbi:MAG: hypothetical protein VYE22_29150 [Myxococcota bacterium]|nr:hypothetical protein [Myxococcota bacterium]